MRTILSKKGERKPPHTSLEGMSGIIIDHTNKYTVVENWLFERGDLSVFDKLIYVVLKSWANCESIWPSHKTIAKKASVSVTTVKKSLAGLIDKKLLVIESRKDSGRCNIYHLYGPDGRKDSQRGGSRHRATPLAATRLPGSRQRATTNTSIQIQDTTTTVVVVDDIKKLVKGTSFQMVDEQSLRKFTAKYGSKYVFDSLDMLIATYRQSERPINSPVAVLASSLLKGVMQPSDYVPYHERIKNDRKIKEAAEQRQRSGLDKRKTDEEAFNKKVAQFDNLPEQDQEKWLRRARTELSPSLKNSKSAVRSMAIELCYKGL